MSPSEASAQSLVPGHASATAGRMLLAALALIQSVGFGWRAAVTETPIGDALFGRMHWPEPLVRALALAMALMCALNAAQALAVLATRGRWCGVCSWWLIAAAIPLAEAFGDAIDHDLWLLLLEGSSQAAVPLALAFAVRGRATTWPLRLACALTFAAHGIIACSGWSRFINLVTGCLPFVDPWQARVMLKGIGVMDLVAAIAVLGRTTRLPLLYMAVWGIATACARTWSGHYALYESLLRAANGGLPLAILLFMRPGIVPPAQTVTALRLDVSAGFAAVAVAALIGAIGVRPMIAAKTHLGQAPPVAHQHTPPYQVRSVTDDHAEDQVDNHAEAGAAVSVIVATTTITGPGRQAICDEIAGRQAIVRPFRSLTVVFDEPSEIWRAERSEERGPLRWQRVDAPPEDDPHPDAAK